MLRALKTYYLKSRVIGLSYHVPKVMTEMTKQDFEFPDEHFLEECQFVHHLAKRWKIDESGLSKSELAKYKESVNDLNKFNELFGTIQNLSAFYWELKTLYLEITREIATPNCWSRREYITKTFEKDVDSALGRYVELVESLKDHPDWQEKVFY